MGSHSKLVRMGYQVGEEKGEDTECLIDSDDKVEQTDDETIGENNTEVNKLLESRQLCSGVILAATSDVFFTANNFIISHFHVIVSDAVLVRCFLQILILTSYIYSRGESLLPGSRRARVLTLLQGISGALALIASLAVMRMIPVVEALSIIYFCPVVTMGCAALMLGDQLNLAKIVSGLVLLIGELLVCQPSFLFPSDTPSSKENITIYLLGYGVAFTACLSGSVHAVFVNMMKTEHVSVPVLVNWIAISVVFLAISFSLIVGDSLILSASISSIHWTDWMILVGLALSGILGFLCVTLSLKMISATLVTSIRSLELVLSLAVTSVLLNQVPSVLASLGVLLVTAGVLVLTFQGDICRKLKITNGDIKEYFKACFSSRHQEYESIP